MEILIINVERSGYSPKQVIDNRDTMTVGELIETLQSYDTEVKVFTAHDNHYTYGGIREGMFEDGEIEEEDY